MDTKELGRSVDGFEECSLSGDCDLYSAPAFASEMIARLERGQRKLRFILRDLRYLDSTGVGAIIRILQTARRLGGEIRFRGLGGSPRKVLEMSNIISIMIVEDGERAAK